MHVMFIIMYSHWPSRHLLLVWGLFTLSSTSLLLFSIVSALAAVLTLPKGHQAADLSFSAFSK